MKFSIRLNNDLPVATYIELAQMAEEYGFDQFWVSHDLFIRSAPVILAAIAANTKRIEIGTSILNPYTIHPSELAMLATTLDEASHGRFNLGLSSGAADFLNWVGIEQKKPRSDLLETITVLRRLFAGEHVKFEGDFLQWTEEAYLRYEPLRQVPIYIGAMSPKMLRSIGEVADGGLPLLFPPEHYTNVAPYIEEGAAKAGRDMDSIDIAACIWCSVSEDVSAAYDPLKEKVAYYGHALSPMLLDVLGLKQEDFTEIEHAMMTERNVEKAKSMVTEQMLQIGIAGTPQMVTERCEKLQAMGVNHISFGPPLGPDVGEAVRLLGKTLVPHFKG